MSTPTRARTRLTRTQRRVLLTVHVAASVSWLGVSIALLVLALAGRFGDGERTVQGAYWADRVFVDVLVIPLSAISLLSGIALGLVTHWGVLRHKWVVTKLVLTTITTGLGIFSLRPGVLDAYHASGRGGDVAALHDAGNGLLYAGCVSTTTYLFVTAISMFKPWGLTRRGRAAERGRAGGRDRAYGRVAG